MCNKEIMYLMVETYPIILSNVSTPRYPPSAVASEMSPAELLLPQHSSRQLRSDNGQLRTTRLDNIMDNNNNGQVII